MNRKITLGLSIFCMKACYGMQQDSVEIIPNQVCEQVEIIVTQEKNMILTREDFINGRSRGQLRLRCKDLCERMYYGIPCGILTAVLTIVIVSMWAK